MALKTLVIYTLLVGNTKYFDVPRLMRNREKYAAKYGLDHFVQTDVKIDNATMRYSWQKLWDAEELLEKYQWVWLLDADAYIMNGEISILSTIGEYSNYDVDILVASDKSSINTGSVLIRRSPYSFQALEKMRNLTSDTDFAEKIYKENPWIKDHDCFISEQDAMIEIMRTDFLNSSIHIRTIPHHLLNSYTWHHLGTEFQRGDFVLHAPGQSKDDAPFSLEKFMAKHNLFEF